MVTSAAIPDMVAVLIIFTHKIIVIKQSGWQ